jgi:hypothetical protein
VRVLQETGYLDLIDGWCDQPPPTTLIMGLPSHTLG